MNIKKFMNIMYYSQDMIKVFTEYANKLDDYFISEDNRRNNQLLYGYYVGLREDLKELAIKHGVVK